MKLLCSSGWVCSDEGGSCVGGREIDGKSGWWRKRDRRKDSVK
jgi:hypothetical protein